MEEGGCSAEPAVVVAYRTYSDSAALAAAEVMAGQAVPILAANLQVCHRRCQVGGNWGEGQVEGEEGLWWTGIGRLGKASEAEVGDVCDCYFAREVEAGQGCTAVDCP